MESLLAREKKDVNAKSLIEDVTVNRHCNSARPLIDNRLGTVSQKKKVLQMAHRGPENNPIHKTKNGALIPDKSIGNVTQLAIINSNNLQDLVREKRGLRRSRDHNLIAQESADTSQVIYQFIDGIVQAYLAANPAPGGAHVAVIGFGSVARRELTVVSDIDLQIAIEAVPVVGVAPVLPAALILYGNNLRAYINAQWVAQQAVVPNANNGLDIDWVGGIGGVHLINGANPLPVAPQMVMGQLMNVWADAESISQSHGFNFAQIRNTAEGQVPLPAILTVVLNQWDADLANPPANNTFSSKNLFIRPLTLAIGILYRERRNQQALPPPYTNNTLARAAFLGIWNVLDHATIANIRTVMLRALKWEERSGIANLNHGAQTNLPWYRTDKLNDMIVAAQQVSHAIRNA